MHQRFKLAAAFAAGTLLAGGGAYAVTNANDNAVHACVNTRTRVMTLAPVSGACPKGTTPLSWNIQGPRGATGAPGAPAVTGTATTGGFDVEALAKRVLPSVVTVNVTFPGGSGNGSGWVTSFPSRAGDGWSYIVTNNHVIDGASTIQVELQDGTDLPATLVGTDPVYDVAVIRVHSADLPALQTGDSSQVVVGEPVMAIGAPLALSGSVTSGIVSALNRPVVTTGSSGTESYIDAIQTDAAINPGNSGGPLFDANGSVIGMNAAIASLGSSSFSQSGSIGLGFSIPVNDAYRVANELVSTAVISNGSVTTLGISQRPILGVNFDTRYTGTGALIATVSPGGGAAAAGIPAGSVVRRIGTQVVRDYTEATAAIRANDPGATTTVTVDLPNNGGSRTFTVTLGTARSN